MKDAGAHDGGNFALSPAYNGAISQMAFACNQRDEARDLHDISAALCAHPSVKQQTFIAENCLTPWDTQQSRVFTDDGTSPTLAGADGGGGRNPAGLVIRDTEAKAAGAEPGDCVVINDQGGDSFSVEKKELSPTLRSETHGNLPIVAVGVSQNQAGDVNTSAAAYSLTANGNATGRNAPLVAHASGVTAKGNGECFLSDECHYTLSCGGGMPGQGYPAALVTHPAVCGTLVASGAGLNRPGRMASETDLCVVVPNSEPIPIQDKATRCNGGGETRDGDGAGNGLGVGKSGDPAPTITSGDRHAVCAYCLQGNMIGRQDHNGPRGDGVNEDLSFTLTATDVAAVATAFNRRRSDLFQEGDIASTQTARQCKDATDLVCQKSTAVDCRNFCETEEPGGTLQAKTTPGCPLNCQNPVRSGFIVRRLLPVECERLQGYGDGWTEFGHDGKPISDTRRYQMLGNSVAVPCVAYILMGIAEQYRKEADTDALCAGAEGLNEG